MANCIMLLGASGTGKSTSIRTLNPEETVIINLLGKRLPFKGSEKMYSKEKKNLFALDNAGDIIRLLENINEAAPHVHNVVCEDMTYVMRKEYFRRTKETSYSKYTEIAQHFQSIIQQCEKMRDDINVFFIMHTEEIVSDNVIVGYQCSTVGKLLLNQYNPIECVPIVLFSSCRYDDKGQAEYGFYTHRCKVGMAEIPAKTPHGLFQDDFIKNDLKAVVDRMQEYYNDETDEIVALNYAIFELC